MTNTMLIAYTHFHSLYNTTSTWVLPLILSINYTDINLLFNLSHMNKITFHNICFPESLNRADYDMLLLTTYFLYESTFMRLMLIKLLIK